jgi:phosphoribosylpyrophosphate synthetase
LPFVKKARKECKATGIATGIHADVHKIEGNAEVQEKNVCILDDIIATGGTIICAIKHLKSLGAKKIIVGATHGVFAGDKIAEKILASSCDRIFITNAILNNNSSGVEIVKLPKD